VVEALAKANHLSAQRIRDIIVGQGGGPGPGRGQGRGAAGGGAGAGGGGRGGGGPGWKTLAQFCADEGLSLTNVLDRLQAKGIKAESTQPLREIAVANGYDRPFALVELIAALRSGEHPSPGPERARCPHRAGTSGLGRARFASARSTLTLACFLSCLSSHLWFHTRVCALASVPFPRFSWGPSR